MSIERTNRLRIALQKAKAGMEHENKVVTDNPSKLGRLLNKPKTSSDERGFIQSQPIHQRPVYGAIAKEVLGEQATYSPTIQLERPHPVSRLNNLRERSSKETIPEGSLGDKVGFASSGQPLWSSILDEQRGMSINQMPPSLSAPSEGDRLHHQTVLSNSSNWPHRLPTSQRKTFKQWNVNAENEHATMACESIIDHLGRRHNPHVIIGAPEAGKSHLLHATGQSVLRYYDGDVRILRASELTGSDVIPSEWQGGIASTSLLLIDDAHVIAKNEEHAQSIGHLVDYALNLGVHVLCTSLEHPRNWPSSRLWDLLKQASSSTLYEPTEASLAMHIKHQASLMGMLFEDAHTMEVLNHSGISWRGVEASLSALEDARDSGRKLLDPEDVTRLLRGQISDSSESIDSKPNSSITLASDIFKRASDVVYSDVDVGGIELHSTALEEQEDDWEPTIVTAEDLSSANDMLEMHLKTTLEELTPEAPTVLDVDSRDRYLTHQIGHVEGRDVGRAADVLAGIDISIDKALSERERMVASDDLRLRHLELMMENLLQRTEHADMDELISITDELRYIQHELGLVSEDSMEAFEAEDEEIKVARLSTIKPRTRLIGEEE